MSRSAVRGFSGALVRRLRERYDWTINDLAGKAGVSPQALSTWEGGRNLPSPPLLKRLADALGVPVVELAPVPLAKTLLSDLRIQSRLTQTHVAESLGVARSFVADLEAGRKVYGQDRAAALADLYGVDQELIRIAWERGRSERATRLRNL